MPSETEIDILMPNFDAGALGVNRQSIEQYFGLWAIEPIIGQQLARQMQGANLLEHTRQVQQSNTVIVTNGKDASTSGEATAPSDSLATYRSEARLLPGGVALIDIVGTVQKRASSFSASTSTVRARQQIRAADRDDSVAQILIRIDSPGGTVSGVSEVFDDIRGTEKPVTVFAEDLCASAGYWIGSAADRFYSNASARIGSIGVFTVIIDDSKAAEELGLKVHVIKTGDFKGAGAPGTAIETHHLEYVQGLIDHSFTSFLEAVQQGRDMKASQLKPLADGRVFIAREAAELGLIDGIKSFDDVVAELRGDPPTKGRARASAHSKGVTTVAKTETEKQEPQAATIDEIEAAAPGCSSDFAMKQLKAKATVDQVKDAWATQLAEDLKATREENEKLKQAAASKATETGGTDPVGTDVEKTGDAGASADAAEFDDPVAEWHAAVQKKIDGGMARDKAVVAVAKKNPELREAYVAACNG